MQITLEALELALAPIRKIAVGEIVFDVNVEGQPLSVALRNLSPEEEVEVQKYANQAITNDADESTSNAAADYMERFKVALLSHALVGIGPADLRDVQYVETGETLANGQKVKVPRYQAVRKLMQDQKWGGSVRIAMFGKYNELTVRMEQTAEQSILFEPSDLDTEIERQEKRLVQLKEERERRKKPQAPTTSVSNKVHTVAKIEEQDRAERSEAVTDYLVKQTPTEAPPRRPVTPATALPPAAPPIQVPAPQGAPATLLNAVPPSPQVAHQNRPMVHSPDDSFVDTGDQEALEAAVEQENHRLLAMRRGQAIPPPSVLGAMRRPPHLDALEVSQEQEAFVSVGSLPDGTAVHRGPTEELTSGDRPAPAGPPPVRQARNPNFQPGGGRQR